MKKVLFVEWQSKGRDFEIDLPLIYFFENYLKWKVKYLSLFNIKTVLEEKPNIVIISNTGGSIINTEFAKLCKNSNILLFSHVSEGLFRKSNIKNMVYGWNKVLNEKHTTYWSKKSYELAIEHFPEVKKKAFISGSLSHDKYAIFSTNVIDKKEYKKVISYLGFDFHNVMTNRKEFEKRLGKEIVDSQEKHIKILNNILKRIIKNNPDILFLLKPHPGDRNKLPKELEGIENYKNVNILYKSSVVDVIRSSDIVLNFQSSTNLEAWLLGKPSITIFEDERFLNLYEVTKGALNVKASKELQKYIDEFYQTRKIQAFEEKKEIREKLIRDLIGFSDGLNHIRFMSFLKPYIEKIENGEIQKGKWNISLKDRLKGYIKHVIYTLSKGKYNIPFLKKYAHIYDMFDDREVEEQKQLRYPDFDKFYKENKEKIDYLYNNWYKIWKKELGIKD